MPPGHVAALAGTKARARRARDRRGLPAARPDRHRGLDRAAAEPLARPARPDERGAHDRRELAGGAGGRTAHPRRGQRRRPPRGVGGRRRPRRALGGRRPALAARCRGLPVLRGPHRRSPRAAGPARAAASPAPTPRRRSSSPPTARRAAEWADGRSAPVRLCVARPVQPVQRADGGRRRRGVRRRRPRRPWPPWRRSRRWRAASRCASFGDVRARLMLAKNPAGWDELLDLVAGSEAPLVVSINARIADGADPSWLWDVPYERLAGRAVVATGDRYRDLSVRLHYGGVRHTTEPEPVQAVARAAARARTRWSTSSGTTPPSTTCWVRRHDGAAAHRGRLPRPAGHLRRRRERPGAGPAGRMARPRGRVAAGRLRPPPPGGRRLLPGWGRGRPPGPRRADAHRRRHAGAPRGARAPSSWRSAPGSRSSGGPFPAPPAIRTRGSGSSTSRR